MFRMGILRHGSSFAQLTIYAICDKHAQHAVLSKGLQFLRALSCVHVQQSAVHALCVRWSQVPA